MALQRIATRLSVVADVLDGRTTLAEAAAVFADLNAAHAEAAEYARVYFAGRSAVEVAALQVIEQVRRSADPRGPATAATLQAEFDRTGAGH